MMRQCSIRALLRQTGLLPFVAGIDAHDGAVGAKDHGGGDRT
jgi:hypothetical protein